MDGDRQGRLAEILAEVQETIERGETLDEAALLVAHPEFAQELDQHLQLLRRMGVPQDVHELDLGDEPPQRLGEYVVQAEIGRGGMGVVYAALQTHLERTVALKVLHPSFLQSKTAVERFHREARAAAALRHPNIVPVHEMSRADGIWYIAMEFVRGRTLRAALDDLVAERRPDGVPAALAAGPSHDGYFAEVATLFAGVADGLECAHRAGVIHRDIKPGNLMFSEAGTLVIVDFGLARIGEPTSLTSGGSLLGTLEYMSPEQARVVRSEVDHRTDVYSLGATLFETVTLTSAFAGETIQEICRAIASDDPPSPSSLCPLLPLALETVILKAIAKDPAERYQSAGAMATDLRRFAAGDPVRAQRAGILVQLGRRLRRVGPAAWAAVVVLGVSGVFAWSSAMGDGAPGSGDVVEKSDPTPEPPVDVDAVYARAIDLYDLARFEDAEIRFRQVVAHRPVDLNAHLYLFRCLGKQRLWEDAVEAVDAALIEVQHAELHSLRAEALEILGRLEQAREAVAAARRLNDSPRRISLEAKLLFHIGDFQELLDFCVSESDARSRLAFIQRYEVVALRALGREQDAYERARELLEGRSRSQPARDAYLYAVLGDAEAAARSWGSSSKNVRCAEASSVLEDREATLKLLRGAVFKAATFPPNARLSPDFDVWKDDAEIQHELRRLGAGRTAP